VESVRVNIKFLSDIIRSYQLGNINGSYGRVYCLREEKRIFRGLLHPEYGGITMPPNRPHGVTSKKTLFFNTDGRTSNLTIVRRVRSQWCGTGVRGPRRARGEGQRMWELCVASLHTWLLHDQGRRETCGRPMEVNNLGPRAE